MDNKANSCEKTLPSLVTLAHFNHTTTTKVCKGCTNHCQLTINKFEGGRTLISGNKCERFTNPGNFKKIQVNIIYTNLKENIFQI